MGNLESRLRQKFGNKVVRTRGRNGREYRVDCCFCDDRKKRMYINPEKYGGCFNCYKCGESGSLKKLLSGYEQAVDPFKPTIEIRRQEPEKHIPSPGQMCSLADLHEDHPAIRYLTETRKRTFDPTELTEVFGVQYCTDGRDFGVGDAVFSTTNTLVFPVWMFDKVVGWQARLLYDPDKLEDHECEVLGFPKDEDGEYARPPKYYTSPGLSKGSVLYNFDVAWKAGMVDAQGRRFVVVTEGPFDAASVGPSAVATFGKGITEVQARLLGTYWDMVFLLLDPGDADEQAIELESVLARSVKTVRVNLRDYKDAGDAPRDEIWKQLVESLEMHAQPLPAATLN